jgi:hypothetical protein
MRGYMIARIFHARTCRRGYVMRGSVVSPFIFIFSLQSAYNKKVNKVPEIRLSPSSLAVPSMSQEKLSQTCVSIKILLVLKEL